MVHQREAELQIVAALDGQDEADYSAALLSRIDAIECGGAECQSQDTWTSIDRAIVVAIIRAEARLYAA